MNSGFPTLTLAFASYLSTAFKIEVSICDNGISLPKKLINLPSGLTRRKKIE